MHLYWESLLKKLVISITKTISKIRAIATRYEKTPRNFLTGLHLVCALAWLK
jgi:transposase